MPALAMDSVPSRTKDLLFTVYAPPGIGGAPVRSHLDDIQGFVKVVDTEAVVDIRNAHSWMTARSAKLPLATPR
jgi:hypothetical protein